MAEQQEPHSLASTYPNPPPFWREFTPDKVARIEELRTAYIEQHGGEPRTTRVPDVPDELVNLQPPSEPVDGRWRVFGDNYMVRRQESNPEYNEGSVVGMLLTLHCFI